MKLSIFLGVSSENPILLKTFHLESSGLLMDCGCVNRPAFTGSTSKVAIELMFSNSGWNKIGADTEAQEGWEKPTNMYKMPTTFSFVQSQCDKSSDYSTSSTQFLWVLPFSEGKKLSENSHFHKWWGECIQLQMFCWNPAQIQSVYLSKISAKHVELNWLHVHNSHIHLHDRGSR